MIAHRLSTIQDADKIVCLDQGRCVTCGIAWMIGLDRSVKPSPPPPRAPLTPHRTHTNVDHSVVEEGDHSQLLARGGLYASMYDMQIHQHSKRSGDGVEVEEGEGDEEEQRRKKRAAWDHRLEKA